ncbi:hypothetical protein HCQ94_04920 [Actinomyces sp. zg-332]|uniref:hypothetical protein n=1 Tax=Actinomyces sp. zg-332 TaxID=2708340 RepID=UPI00141DADC2|nr:hypothetical protein [Actinomyces sp. zg-332]QPK93920.1 hypothetical protein HCQ94_04920 [Actinomyces sp. zg-332]
MENILAPSTYDIVILAMYFLYLILLAVAIVFLLKEHDVFENPLRSLVRLLAIIFIPIVGPIYSLYLSIKAKRFYN